MNPSGRVILAASTFKITSSIAKTATSKEFGTLQLLSRSKSESRVSMADGELGGIPTADDIHKSLIEKSCYSRQSQQTLTNANTTEPSDDELESSSLDLIKSDRLPSTKPEEDRRRRTIIVEKKNGSYGFTLQSYGIHYKKEQEVEMITYVDYVEYDGPAYKAGMREGDVILSINGTDMEKADHKTLVAFIKACDSRMRMVVLFEDCVRKVELHMRYIQLQTSLQNKMNDLERVCLRERELLEGKWKTHSLPARKKAMAQSGNQANGPNTNGERNASTPVETEQTFYNRPTLSTENVTKIGRPKVTHIIPPPAQFMLTYQYLDPHFRYVLRPATNNQGEYLVSLRTSHNRADYHYFIPCNLTQPQEDNTVGNNHNTTDENTDGYYKQSNDRTDIYDEMSESIRNSQAQLHNQTKEKNKHCYGHSCNPCIGHFNRNNLPNNGDNISLDAYDLANSCCDASCVPTRRRMKQTKEHIHKEHQHKHRHQRDKERRVKPQRAHSLSKATASKPFIYSQNSFDNQCSNRHYDMNTRLISNCSLHSCTSSNAGGGPDSSMASYTTSLSTDTLCYDAHDSKPPSRHHSTKSRQQVPIHQSHETNQTFQAPHQYIQRYMHGAQIQPIQNSNCSQCVNKPKSWDNLSTAKNCATLYNYACINPMCQSIENSNSLDRGQNYPENKMVKEKIPYLQRYSMGFQDIENYAPPPTQFLHEARNSVKSTKSTDNLLVSNFKKSGCDCTDEAKQRSHMSTSPISSKASIIKLQYQPKPRPQMDYAYYSSLPPTSTSASKSVATISEITRL